MATKAPVLALVGATGLIGSALLPSFTAAVQSGRLSTLRILTSSASSSKLYEARKASGVEIKEVHYADQASLLEGLKGVDALVSAMGAAETGEGKYEENKATSLDAALKAGVKVYVPSEWGTDHNGKNNGIVDSPIFHNKAHHHAEAESQGLQVLAIYCGLVLEISFSDWLGIPISSASPTWTIPSPVHPVAFTSLSDLGPFTLSAVLQAFASSSSASFKSIPSRLRISSDVVTLDRAADFWEKYASGKVQRNYQQFEELKKTYEEIKPTLKSGLLGPAIPLMMSVGGFDHTKDDANPLLNAGDYEFRPKTVEEFLKGKAQELRK
ncbi:hypothetical protein JCM11641_000354 [Rhodosporidiobolus odoratus]